MKIQCSCGAKYAFDVTPETAQTPVRFVCPACGVDSSDFVNRMIRQELGLPEPAVAPSPPPVARPIQAAPGSRPLARVRTYTPETVPTEAEPVAADEAQRCSKHPDQFVTGNCHICSKPICPKCMALFGYVCSPLCRGKAEAKGIEIPVYAGQRSVREARKWRWVGAVAGVVGGLLVAVVGVWVWYAWFGSVPRTYWSVRFDEPAYSGQSAFYGKDQIVFIHGDTLARYDMKLKKEIWSRHLVDKKEIEAAIAKEMKGMQAVIDKANDEDPDHVPRMPDPEKLWKSAQRTEEEGLDLRVRGENIWVLKPGKLTRFDRETGNPLKEIPVPAGYGGLVPRGDELLNVDVETGKPIVTHINLNTCETRTEEISGPPAIAELTATTNLAGTKPAVSAALAASRSGGKAGLPVGMPGRDAGKVMDPKKVAEQAQRLPYATRIALPAVLAHNLNQERTLAAADDQPASDKSAASAGPDFTWNAALIPTKEGFVEFSAKLIESRIVTREAMKPPPAKSVLSGSLTVNKTDELSNEKLNEAQRDRGGGVVQEDESRYLATIRRSDIPEVWSGEVVGRPSLYPLTTVNVLTANKIVLVFDKQNKKLWQSALSYNVSGGYGNQDNERATFGLGPCVESKDTLYVIDQGVLTAFDLATGNARWRLPSIGIMGLFFDGEGMIYLNTTTASPDSLKYSNQIDINRKDSYLVMKLEPKAGKVQWTADVRGLVSYVSDKFIYSVRSYHADNDEESATYTLDSIAGRESELVIKRLNPKNGRVMWEHVQKRAPLDVEFDQNTIRLVFKHEVQVLRFVAF
jgi:hypothetical protein